MDYRFDQFELRPATRELLAAGQPRAIEPKVFDLLCLLIERRDHVVSRDELIATVWNGRIVSDSAIAARLSAARAAIDDDGSRQLRIRTIPRRGVRFVATVTATAAPEGAAQQTATAAHSLGAASAPGRQRIAYVVSADGTRIAYARSGHGPPLVKAGHWLTHLEHDWQSPIWRPLLDRFGERHTLIRYDQRGNGLSDWNVADLTLPRFVDDLAAVVDACGLDRFPLYATSQGVPIAIGYAARHPERVSHLVLHGGFERGRLLRAPEERAEGEAILTLIRHGWGRPGSAFLNAFAAMFIPGGTREQLDSLVALQRTTTSPEIAARLRAAVDHFDASAAVSVLRLPTLVIHAREDGIQPLEQGRQLAARIAGAEFVPLDSPNHVVLSHEPAWTTLFEAIERFLPGGDR